MKVYTCEACGQLVFFDNSLCERCGHALGFDDRDRQLLTLRPHADDPDTLDTLGAPSRAFRRCDNAERAGCNWLVPAEAPGLCTACALTRRIPDLSVPENVKPWQDAEAAKRRLVYALLRLGLPLARTDGPALVFDILSDAAEEEPVLTGHQDGLITINLAEADSAERERRRVELGEAYRTMLGHFRHEVGHFYWDALVADRGHVDSCRAVFGDESEDYAEAVDRHYRDGPPAGWQESFVSAYSTMHPWEDFAETWAHYLHIVDSLDTAAAFGIAVAPEVTRDPELRASIGFDPYRAPDAEQLVAAWLPLSYALNSLNRSMGQPDLYPFVLAPPAIEKLGYVHRLIQGQPTA